MSNRGFLEKLLNGASVEWVPLKRVANIKHGKDWKKLNEGDVPVYGSGGIMGYVDTFSHDKPTVLIPRKGSITNIFYVDVPFWNVDTIYYTDIDTDQVVPKYLYHFIKNIDLMALDTGSGRPSLTQAILNRLEIPIPCPDEPEKSLEIQAEIVRILDTFTELTAELTAELTVELENRRRQYEFYSRELLSFDDNDAEWTTLGEIASIGTGSRNTNEAVPNGRYPFFVRSQEPRAIDEFEFDDTAIITAGDGVGVGKVFHYISGKYALHQRAYRIVVTDSRVQSKYLFHYIRKNFGFYLRQTSVHASVTSLRMPMFQKYPVPIPKEEGTQARIIATLDKFDAVSGSLGDALPSEIELRRVQYEYYRDMLFSFPKPEEAA